MEQRTGHILDIERRRSLILSNLANAATKKYYQPCLNEFKIDDIQKFIEFQTNKSLIGNWMDLTDVENDINEFVKCRIYE